MTNLIKFQDFQDAQIRVTDDGRYSVYDVIKFCSNYKSGGERNAWKRLTKHFPEYCYKVAQYNFPGKRGAAKATPVADRQTTLEIIGLLPGAFGKSYRQDAAKIFIQYIDASPELAESVIDRAKPEDLDRIQKRLQSKQIRLSFTNTLAEHGVTEGWQFGAITNTMYKEIVGGTAKEIRLQRNIPVRQNIRDAIDSFELTGLMFGEELAKRKIETKNLRGFKQCNNATKEAAQKVSSLMEEV